MRLYPGVIDGLTLSEVVASLVGLYEVVYGTYAGEFATFPSTNLYLSDWLCKYGDCVVTKIEYAYNENTGYYKRIFLDGWNSR